MKRLTCFDRFVSLHQVDDYHGTKICDPYVWLEDPDSAETVVCFTFQSVLIIKCHTFRVLIMSCLFVVFQAFVEEQNKLTLPFLEQCAVRAKFHERLTNLYDYPKYSCPYKRGKRSL